MTVTSEKYLAQHTVKNIVRKVLILSNITFNQHFCTGIVPRHGIAQQFFTAGTLYASNMKTLHNKYILIFIIAILSSCQNNADTVVISGDLYFSFFRFGSTYHLPDSISDRIYSYFDTLDYQSASENDKLLFDSYQIIKSNNLIDKPYVDLRTDSSKIIMLYLEKPDYNLIKVHKRQELQDDSSKVVINAVTTRFADNIYYCDSLISIDKVAGQTLQKQRKFSIEDYN